MAILNLFSVYLEYFSSHAINVADELYKIKILHTSQNTSLYPKYFLKFYSTYWLKYYVCSSLKFYPPMIWQWFVHRPYTSLPNSTHAYQLVTSDFQFIENQARRMFSNIHSTETHCIISLIMSYLCNSIAP